MRHGMRHRQVRPRSCGRILIWRGRAEDAWIILLQTEHQFEFDILELYEIIFTRISGIC